MCSSTCSSASRNCSSTTEVGLLQFLIVAAGSHGDVLPFIGLGRTLQARGHAVQLFASEPFAPLAAEAGLPFTAVLSADEYRRLLNDPAATHPRKGLALLAQAVETAQRRCGDMLAAACQPGRTVLVGSSLAWGVRLLGERLGMPAATVHLSPAWLRSEHQAPSFGPLGPLNWAPRALKRGLYRWVDRRLLDPLFARPFNALRAEHGLPPVERLFDRWMHSADLTLGLFPPWFSPRQPDWPAGLQLTGFPLYDHAAHAALPEPVARFLDAGDAPVAFTAGTANTHSQAFFAASVQACLHSGRCGLLLTQDASQLPRQLPPQLMHAAYVPFSALLPRLAALVHHGGIGTTSQALQAGVPQLVRPMAFDQFDNARRVVDLGVARQLMPRRYRPAAVARALEALCGDAALRARCQAVATQLRAEGSGLPAAADALLRLAAQRGLLGPAG